MIALIAMLLTAGPGPAPPCRAAQLTLSRDGRDGDFDGMSHSGTQLVVRNTGPDCAIAALPPIEFRDARGRVLNARRRPPAGMHPGPVMLPVRLATGARATTDLRWVSGPVYPDDRVARAAAVALRIGRRAVRVPIVAEIHYEAGETIAFDQSPLRAAAAD